MLKQSIFAIPTELLHSHLRYIINHDEHFNCFMQRYNRMTTQDPAFPAPVALCEHHGHSNWNQTAEFSSV